MSNSHENLSKENAKDHECTKQELDEHVEAESCKFQDEDFQNTPPSSGESTSIVLDPASEKVQALEQELSERKKQIVTSFQLQELNNLSRGRRRSSVSSNIVIWSRAEEQ